GPPLGKALALLIAKSNKARDVSGKTTGRFGIGKFTIYAGTDDVEIIANNGREAYYFEVSVEQKTGYLKVRKVIRLNPQAQPLGVTIRRMNRLDETIPEIEKSLRERMAKVMVGLAQNDHFKIQVMNAKGEYKAIEVRKNKVVAEADVELGGVKQTARLLSVMDSDIPSQVVDGKGLRVADISVKEEFLKLIPTNLRHHWKSLGLVIQLPLPPTQNRDSFEYENENMDSIRMVVAVLFYRALVFKTLFDKSFVLGLGFPQDWETSADKNYWESVMQSHDPWNVDLTEDINNNRLTASTGESLAVLRDEIDGRSGGVKGDVEKKNFTKFIVRLKVFPEWDRAKSALSILDRRAAAWAPFLSERVRTSLGKSLGISFNDAVKGFNVLGVALPVVDSRKKKGPKVIFPENWTADERKFMTIVQGLARAVGQKKVYLAEVDARGLYQREVIFWGKDGTIYVNRLLAQELRNLFLEPGIIHGATNTVLHELGHAGENVFNGIAVDQYGAAEVTLSYTHDAEGGQFSRSMGLAAAAGLGALALRDKPLSDALSGEDKAMSFEPEEATAPGGIDLSADKIHLETRGENGQEIKFDIDPVLMERLKNAPGLVPVIINLEPANNLPEFFGIASSQ
ncbi:MAG: hypothetical protein HQL16_04335, partial [Candidatus Omnitrophica bacterium]|nr:hypothetical protein [Candidatus Omnitrophota bacterium]